MTVTATDDPAIVKVSENGAPGKAGENGSDGIGFNGVRKALIDNPLTWLYSKNNLVRVLSNTLTVSRSNPVAYTDIYGDPQTAPIDTPKQEVKGWLIDPDEAHQFETYDNIPLLSNDFTFVIRVGAYSSASVGQDLLKIPSLNGDVLKASTNLTGNYEFSLLGDDLVNHLATTTVSANSTTTNVIIGVYKDSVLNIYINNTLSGSVTNTSTSIDPMDLNGLSEISGDYNLNIEGLRFYDFALNQDEITYLND